MKKIVLTLINIVLAAVLIYILIYPSIQARKVVEAKILFEKDISNLPLLVALEKGYFDSLKVNVQVEEVAKPGDEVDDVIKGAAQLGSGIPATVLIFKSITRPEAVRMVYETSSTIANPYDAIFVRKERRRSRRIRRYKDFLKKKIGYLRGSFHDILLKNFLKSEGLDVDRMVFVALTPQEMLTALQDKIVDVALVTEPMRSALLKDKRVTVFEDAFLEKHFVTPFPIGMSMTSLANVNLKKRAVQRIVGAIDMAIDFIRSNPDEAVQIVRREFNIPEDVDIILPKFSKYYEIEEAHLTKFAQVLLENGIILVEVDPTTMILKDEEIR